MSTSWNPHAARRDATHERRAFQRFPLSIAVHLQTGEVAWTARTVNVSASGALASASLILAPGQTVELWFRFPGSARVVALAGHVARLGAPGADGEPCDRMALAFDRAAFGDRESLAAALARLASRANSSTDNPILRSPYPPTEIPHGVSAPRGGRRNGAASAPPLSPLSPRRLGHILALKQSHSRTSG